MGSDIIVSVSEPMKVDHSWPTTVQPSRGGGSKATNSVASSLNTATVSAPTCASWIPSLGTKVS